MEREILNRTKKGEFETFLLNKERLVSGWQEMLKILQLNPDAQHDLKRSTPRSEKLRSGRTPRASMIPVTESQLDHWRKTPVTTDLVHDFGLARLSTKQRQHGNADEPRGINELRSPRDPGKRTPQKAG
jgi:hypothetical protein